MNRALCSLLSISLAVMIPVSPVLAQRVSSSARTSVNRGNVKRSNTNVNANKNVNANINRNVNVNSNRNVNVNVDHDVHVHGGYYGGACCYHDNTGAVIAATAIVTAAVIGSRVYSLPPACSVVVVNGFTYQQCGSTWYQPQFVGTTTSYVVVAAPR